MSATVALALHFILWGVVGFADGVVKQHAISCNRTIRSWLPSKKASEELIFKSGKPKP
jgi:hypothetical protein